MYPETHPSRYPFNLKEDLPPAYPGNGDDEPPSYQTATSGDVNILIREENNQLSSNPYYRRSMNYTPLAPRVVAGFDMVFNVPSLLFCFTLMVHQSAHFPLLWIIAFNFPWLLGAYNLYASSNVDLPSEERKQLTVIWVNFNYFLLIVVAALITFVAFLALRPVQVRGGSTAPLALFMILVLLIPFLIRLIFCIVIRDYVKGI